MSYIGIGYNGDDERLLSSLAQEHMPWLRGDRVPRFFGDRFVVLYDSNTAREFVKKCRARAGKSALTVFHMERAAEA
jgi:hypothetical protein